MQRGYISSAYALERLQHYDLALREVGRALDLNPDSAEAHTCGAWILRQSGRLDEAEKEVRSALTCDPLNANAHNVLACILWSKGKVLDAEQAFEIAISHLSPDTPLYLTNYARLTLARARPSEALAIANRALALSPSRSAAHEVKGEAYLALGDYGEAITALLTALQLDPRNAQAHNSLGKAHLAHGQAESAQESFIDALRLKPDFTSAQTNLVTALQAQYHLYGRLLAFTLRRNSVKGRASFVRASIIAFIALLLLPTAISLVIGSGPLMSQEVGHLWTPIFFSVFAIWLVAILGRRTLEPMYNLLLWLDKRNRPVVRFEASAVIGTGFLFICLVSLLIYGALLIASGPDTPATALALYAGGAGLAVVLLSGGMYRLELTAPLHRRITWANYGLLIGCIYAVAAGSAYSAYNVLSDINWVVWLLLLSLGLYAALWVVRRLDARRVSTNARASLTRTMIGLASFGLIGVVTGFGLGYNLLGASVLGTLLVSLSPFIMANKRLQSTSFYKHLLMEQEEADAQKRVILLFAGAYACLCAVILAAHYLLAG